MKTVLPFVCVLILFFLSACGMANTPEPSLVPVATPLSILSPTVEDATSEPVSLSITLGDPVLSTGITFDSGGDVDTIAVEIEGVSALQSGNGVALISADGNGVPDSYLQFNLDDDKISKGLPVGRVRLEVDYLDSGTDSFSLQYDAKPTEGSDGAFSGGGSVVKTGSGEFKTAVFNLCDVYFANRVNGADFRIGDDNNGAETIREIRVFGIESSIVTIFVDDFGANPMDDLPDSEAIQTALDSTCSGDTIVFTSGVNTSGYQGYMIDKTLFLTGMSAKHDLTFTSSNPEDHALLRATRDLLGFVVQLFARSRFINARNIYNIDFGYIDVDGGRDVRVCMGPDGVGNGESDNWGSWLPECTEFDDAWCSPGNLAFNDFSNNVVVHDLINEQTECGTAFSFGGFGGTIRNVTIETAGDHVHNPACTNTDSDSDGDFGAWADGITLVGSGHQIIDNTIINPSDIGIVHFGGQDTIIANNTVRITAGNYGAFGAIALHPWVQADASGVQITGNTIISEGDSTCGGLHLGINIGAHLWNWGCVENAHTGAFGNPGCSAEPDPMAAAPCTSGTCQLWLVVPEGKTLTMKDNVVTGSQVNYFIEGMINNGQFIDENNISLTPQETDWQEADNGCYGIPWGPLDKAAHHPTLSGYIDLIFHCY